MKPPGCLTCDVRTSQVSLSPISVLVSLFQIKPSLCPLTSETSRHLLSYFSHSGWLSLSCELGDPRTVMLLRVPQFLQGLAQADVDTSAEMTHPIPE